MPHVVSGSLRRIIGPAPLRPLFRPWRPHMEGEREMPFDRVRRISLMASRLHGDNDLAVALLSPSYEVTARDEATADGSLDDELADLMIVAGQLGNQHRAKQPDQMDASIAKAEAVLNRIKAERDRL